MGFFRYRYYINIQRVWIWDVEPVVTSASPWGGSTEMWTHTNSEARPLCPLEGNSCVMLFLCSLRLLRLLKSPWALLHRSIFYFKTNNTILRISSKSVQKKSQQHFTMLITANPSFRYIWFFCTTLLHLFVWILFPTQLSYNLSMFYFVSSLLGWFIHFF